LPIVFPESFKQTQEDNMAMPLRPTDGLVSRLLQQQSRGPSNAPATTSASSNNTTDRISISIDARDPESGSNFKQQDLESQLLRLYTHHNKSGG